MNSIRKFNVAVTDAHWIAQLSAMQGVTEINFWQPSASGVNDPPGTPWLFKRKSPKNDIVGGGFFTYYTPMSPFLAWKIFGECNGVGSLDDLLERVQKYRGSSRIEVNAHNLGCVILTDPFFFLPDQYIPAPADWKPNIVKGRHYSVEDPIGARLWAEVMLRLEQRPIASMLPQAPAFGKPILVAPRLGQRAFRAQVLDAYDRRCSITGERTVPVIEAAHIRPYAESQNHDVKNGIALRSDLHTLYDAGYVSIRPDGIFVVSKQIREEFSNGKEYYALDGTPIRMPENPVLKPREEHLEWHYSERFLG
jgi:putative restriction endonuclease